MSSIALASCAGCHLVQAELVSVVHSHNPRTGSALNQLLHEGHMALPAAAHADEPDPDRVVRTQHPGARHIRCGSTHRGDGRRFYRR